DLGRVELGGRVVLGVDLVLYGRGRNTLWADVWTADVRCADLVEGRGVGGAVGGARVVAVVDRATGRRGRPGQGGRVVDRVARARSEERRVGKECRCRRLPHE